MQPSLVFQWLLAMPRPVKRALAVDAHFTYQQSGLRLEAWVGLDGRHLPAVFTSLRTALRCIGQTGWAGATRSFACPSSAACGWARRLWPRIC